MHKHDRSEPPKTRPPPARIRGIGKGGLCTPEPIMDRTATPIGAGRSATLYPEPIWRRPIIIATTPRLGFTPRKPIFSGSAMVPTWSWWMSGRAISLTSATGFLADDHVKLSWVGLSI